MRFTPTKKISELPALSPATLDTTFVVGISGSTTYKISINQLTSSLDTTFATDLVTTALSNSLDTKLATTIFNTNSSSFHSRINAVSASVSTGTSGTSGTSGPQGNQGPIGPQGINGTAGSSGVQGPQGNQGENGSSGTSGANGTSGSDGTSGTSGLSGTSGTNGTNGTSGAQGNQGNVGPQGTQGEIGPQGNQGISGTSGTDGTSGINGTSGTDGTSGTSGFSIDSASFATTGSNLFKGDQTITGSLFVNGTTELGGNIVPKEARGATLGTELRPFKGIFVSSGSINIASDIIGDPNTTLSNVGGNILVSAGGMRLVGDASFIAATGSFQYISGSMRQVGNYTQDGNYVMVGNKTITGSLSMLGSTNFSELTGSLSSFSSSVDYRIKNISLTPGTSGTSGTSGTNGAQGSQGPQGINGTAGSSGVQGSQGNQGPQGNQGASGAQGNQGANGSNGAQGNQGATGSNGAQGNQGPIGPQGNQGAQGPTGGTGPQGNQGPTGAQGVQGVQGTTFNISQYSGSVGITGSLTVSSIGISDSAFLTNTSSFTLTSGSNLYVKNNGIIEITGSLYVTGSTNFSELTGSLSAFSSSVDSRIRNISGSVGAQGAQGNQGPTGAQGNQGVTGSNGAQGNQGPQGNQGNTGANGTSGTNGSQGNQGPQGNQGTTGSQGADGNQGTQGPQGINGTSGQSGTSGTTGTSGTSGVSDKYQTTSVSTFTLGVSGSITVATGLAYTTAQDVLISNDLTHHQISSVVSYNSGTGVLVFSAPSETIGTGTFSSWNVNLAGATGGNGTNGTSGTSANATANYYGIFYSTGSQNVTAANTETIISLDTTDGHNGISITSGSRITATNSGVYEFIVSPQLEKTQGSDANVSIWLKKNGTPIVDTNSIVSLVANSSLQLPAVPYIVSLNAGEYVQFAFSSNSQHVRITNTGAGTSPTRPQAPSVIVTAKQVGLVISSTSGTSGAQGNQGPTGPQGNQGASGTSGTTGTSGTSPSGVATTTVNPDYIQAGRITSDQTAIGVNTDIIFNTALISSGISLNTSTGAFTLAANKTYRLLAGCSWASFSDASNGYIIYDWVDATTNTALNSSGASKGVAEAINRNTSEFNATTANLIYTPSTNQTIKLRIVEGVGTATLRSSIGTSAIIEQINPTVTVTNGTNGAAGTSGAQGPQGNQGPAGSGAQGAQGPAGGTGPQGNQGNQGPQGNQGNQGTTFNINQYSGSVFVTGSLTVSSAIIVSSSMVANTSSLYLTSGSNLYVQNNGLVEITGSLVVSGSTISLTSTVLQVGTGSGDEGGEILLAKSQTNNSLTGSGVTIDSFQNRLRIFEQGGDARGVHIDLTKAPAGVNGELVWKASNIVNAGTFVTLDNLKATITTTSNRGLSLATVSGTVSGYVSGHYQGIVSSSSGNSSSTSLSTSATTSLFGWNFTSEGDMSTYILRDNTNNRVYRIILIIGGGYSNNFISIERLY